MARKKKIDILHQVDGRDHSIDTSKMKSVDEIFGFEKSKFNTTDAAVYSAELKQMNKSDLQKEATSKGLIPIDDRFVLAERLMKEFTKHQGLVAASRFKNKQITVSKGGLDILAEGAN